MDTTILIPTFNHEKSLVRAFRSVAFQTCFKDCEVLISDDLSTDCTYELACEIESRYPNVIARRNEKNLGVMPHYRVLLAHVQTEYVAILEGDDKWTHEGKINLQWAMLKANPKMSCNFTAYHVFHEEAKRLDRAPTMSGNDRYRLIYFPELLRENLIGSFTNCMYRTEVLRDIICKGVDRAGYDWLANLQIADVGPIGYVPVLGAQYNVHPNGMWSGLSGSEQRRMIISTLKELAATTSGIHREITLLEIDRWSRM